MDFLNSPIVPPASGAVSVYVFVKVLEALLSRRVSSMDNAQASRQKGKEDDISKLAARIEKLENSLDECVASERAARARLDEANDELLALAKRILELEALRRNDTRS